MAAFLRTHRTHRIILRVLLCLPVLGLFVAATPQQSYAASGSMVWSDPKTVSANFVGSNVDSTKPIFVQGTEQPTPTLHFAWLNGQSGSQPWRVIYRNSTDNGATFGAVDILSSNQSTLSSTLGDITGALDSQGRFHIVWSERLRLNGDSTISVYYRRRNANGSWTPALDSPPVGLASNGSVDPYAANPGLDISIGTSDLIHVVWSSTAAIYYTNSTNGGASWNNLADISGGCTGVCANPYILTQNNGTAHVVWSDGSGTSKPVHASHLTDVNMTTGAGTWKGGEIVEDGYGQQPTLARDPSDGTLYAAYQTYDGPDVRTISFARWKGVGQGWTTSKVAARGTVAGKNIGANPTMIIDSSHNMYIAFDVTAGSVTGEGVFYVTSRDGGATWTSTGTIVTNQRAVQPQLRWINGTIYLIYAQRIDGGAYQVLLRTAAPIGPQRFLSFSTQPGGAQATHVLAYQPVLAVRNADGGIKTDYTGAVRVALKQGTGATGATLSGTTTVNAVAGIATFTDLAIDRAGEGYVLTASADDMAAIESSVFVITDAPPFIGLQLRVDPVAIKASRGKTYVATLGIVNATSQPIAQATTLTFSLSGIKLPAGSASITGGATVTNITAPVKSTPGSITATLDVELAAHATLPLTLTINAKGGSHTVVRASLSTYGSNRVSGVKSSNATQALINFKRSAGTGVVATFLGKNEPVQVLLTPVASGFPSYPVADSTGTLSLPITGLTAKKRYKVTIVGEWSGITGIGFVKG